MLVDSIGVALSQVCVPAQPTDAGAVAEDLFFASSAAATSRRTNGRLERQRA
jgi:hypothetical protein